MVSSCQNSAQNRPLFHEQPTSMSSYLPMRHAAPRGDELHAAAENAGYMEHFLNIPDICPTGNYRAPRYYMGSYQTEQCRMDAIQHRNHDLRMGLQPNRHNFYPNMTVPGMRFGENCGADPQANCGPPPHGRVDSMSPCSKTPTVTGTEAPESSTFYPWMSIVGQWSLSLSPPPFVSCCSRSLPCSHPLIPNLFSLSLVIY